MINKSHYISFNDATASLIAPATVDQKIISYQTDRYVLLQGFDMNYLSFGVSFNDVTDNPMIHCWQTIIIDGEPLFDKNRQPVDTGAVQTFYYPFPINTIIIDAAGINHRMHSNHYHFVSGGIVLIPPGEKIEVYITNTMTTASVRVNYTLFLEEVFKEELERMKNDKVWRLNASFNS